MTSFSLKCILNYSQNVENVKPQDIDVWIVSGEMWHEDYKKTGFYVFFLKLSWKKTPSWIVVQRSENIHVWQDVSISVSVSNCFEFILSKVFQNSQSRLIMKMSSMNLYVLYHDEKFYELTPNI